MSDFITKIHLTNHDDLYQQLVDLHDGKTEEESRKINAKLIVTMMNQIGEPSILREIFELVKRSSEQHQGR